MESIEQFIRERGLCSEQSRIHRNGSIGYVAEASPSIQPIIQRVEERQEKKTGKTYYPAPKLSDRTMPYYRSAYDMSMLDMIDVYAEATKHVDQGISMSVYFAKHIKAGLYPWKTGDNEYNTRDLSLVRSYAHAKGIKSMYYTRSTQKKRVERTQSIHVRVALSNASLHRWQ